VERLDQTLSGILVETDPTASGSWRRAYDYELVVTPLHERDVLNRINIRRAGGGRLTVAELGYAFWEDSSTGRASGPLWATPQSCSYSKLWKDAVWDIEPVGMNYTGCILADVNRDGLPDMLYGGSSAYTPDPTKTFALASSDWHVQRMLLDLDGDYFFEPDLAPWNGPASAPVETVVEGELSPPQTVKTIALTQDVDGDGYPDLVRSE